MDLETRLTERMLILLEEQDVYAEEAVDLETRLGTLLNDCIILRMDLSIARETIQFLENNLANLNEKLSQAKVNQMHGQNHLAASAPSASLSDTDDEEREYTTRGSSEA